MRRCDKCGDTLAHWRAGTLCGECIAPTNKSDIRPPEDFKSTTRGRTEGQRVGLGKTAS